MHRQRQAEGESSSRRSKVQAIATPAVESQLSWLLQLHPENTGACGVDHGYIAKPILRLPLESLLKRAQRHNLRIGKPKCVRLLNAFQIGWHGLERETVPSGQIMALPIEQQQTQHHDQSIYDTALPGGENVDAAKRESTETSTVGAETN